MYLKHIPARGSKHLYGYRKLPPTPICIAMQSCKIPDHTKQNRIYLVYVYVTKKIQAANGVAAAVALDFALAFARSFAFCSFSCSVVSGSANTGASGSFTGPATCRWRASSSSSTSSSSWLDICPPSIWLISCIVFDPVSHSQGKDHKLAVYTYVLICPRLLRLSHQLLHPLQPAHLLMNRLQHTRPLLQPKQDVLLNKRKLHATSQPFELFKLSICLSEQ